MGKTLYQHYRNEIKGWDWERIKADALSNIYSDPADNDYESGWSFLGTCFELAPSGKYYLPFACSNVSAREVHRDEAWYRALDDVASEHGMYIQSGEGDPCDIFAVIAVEEEEEEENE